MDTIRPDNSTKMYENSPQTTVRGFEVITPNDTTTFDPFYRSLRVGNYGDVVVTDIFGTDVTFENVQDGETLPIWVSKVKATGTTATNIIGYLG